MTIIHSQITTSTGDGKHQRSIMFFSTVLEIHIGHGDLNGSAKTSEKKQEDVRNSFLEFFTLSENDKFDGLDRSI